MHGIDAAYCDRYNVSCLFVCLSVCLSVCLLGTRVSPAKRLSRSRCDLGADERGLKEPSLDWIEIPTGRGQFLGFVLPIEKQWESLLQCTQQKIS